MYKLSNLTDDELIEQYHDLVYSSVDSRSRDARLVRTELLRRSEATKKYMREHPDEVVELERKHGRLGS